MFEGPHSAKASTTCPSTLTAKPVLLKFPSPIHRQQTFCLRKVNPSIAFSIFFFHCCLSSSRFVVLPSINDPSRVTPIHTKNIDLEETDLLTASPLVVVIVIIDGPFDLQLWFSRYGTGQGIRIFQYLLNDFHEHLLDAETGLGRCFQKQHSV